MAVPDNIEKLAREVRNAIYGSEVREAIASSMEATGEVAEWSREVAQQIIDGAFDEGELNTEIERKLNELESQYAPDLNSLKNEVGNARGNESTLEDRLNSSDQQLAEIPAQIEQAIEPKADKEYVESELNKKANDSDLGVERERINNLVAHAGDTDGNAELLDIRIGWDGTVYPTAGEAVRNILTPFMTAENEEWVI